MQAYWRTLNEAMNPCCSSSGDPLCPSVCRSSEMLTSPDPQRLLQGRGDVSEAIEPKHGHDDPDDTTVPDVISLGSQSRSSVTSASEQEDSQCDERDDEDKDDDEDDSSRLKFENYQEVLSSDCATEDDPEALKELQEAVTFKAGLRMERVFDHKEPRRTISTTSTSDESFDIATVSSFASKRVQLLSRADEFFEAGIDRWGEEEYGPALDHFLKCLQIRETILGKVDPVTAKTYLWVGSMYWKQNDRQKALEAFMRSCRITMEATRRRGRCGVLKDWILQLLDELEVKRGIIFWKMFLCCVKFEMRADRMVGKGQYRKAYQEYQRALQLEMCRRREFGLERPRILLDVADLHVKAAYALLLSNSEYDLALLECRRAFSIYSLKNDTCRKYLTDVLELIRKIGFNRGCRSETIEIYLQSMHQSVAHERTGDRLMERRDLGLALREYRQALRIEECSGFMGSFSLASAAMHTKVGCIVADEGGKGNITDALASYCKAVAIYEGCYGVEHAETKRVMKLIYLLLSKMK